MTAVMATRDHASLRRQMACAHRLIHSPFIIAEFQIFTMKESICSTLLCELHFNDLVLGNVNKYLMIIMDTTR